jgi:hypothetical protein
MTHSHSIRTTFALLAVSLALVACRGATGADVTDSDEDAQLPPPAAALYTEGGIGLEARLERLDADLGRVLEGDLDEESQQYLLAAEAVTDRLLEDEPGSEWLGTGYYVEARLRQIQALADRIIAELRRGVVHELVLEDIAALRLAVRDLRNQLAQQGNGDAPPLLDSLLAGSIDDPRIGLGGRSSSSASADTGSSAAAPAPEPAAAPEGGPLGEPIRP